MSEELFTPHKPDPEKDTWVNLSNQHMKKVNQWLSNVVYPKYWEQNPNANRQDYPAPYQGVSGGGVTYCFTPTSIGVVFKVKTSYTEDELDLTDYDNW